MLKENFNTAAKALQALYSDIAEYSSGREVLLRGDYVIEVAAVRDGTPILVILESVRKEGGSLVFVTREGNEIVIDPELLSFGYDESDGEICFQSSPEVVLKVARFLCK